MGVKGLVLLSLMGLLAVSALAYPFAGIAAYLMHYHVYPEQSWWGASLSAAGLRYSYTITLLLVVGALIHWGKLPYRRLFTSQELLFGCFLAWLFISRALTGAADQDTSGTTDPVEKMLKLAVFLFILTHVVVTEKQFDRLCRVFVLCALYIGWEAYTAPAGAFYQGRLENYVGGPDFAEANMLGAHCLVLASLIGMTLLRTRSGYERFLCLIAGCLIGNTIIQTRSRGAIFGLGVGLILALVLAPKGKRKWVWGASLVGCLGLFVLMDRGFLSRMETIEGAADNDASAQLRLEVWRLATEMIANNPFGVGPGNFRAHVPEVAGMKRDTHSTYLRCAAELGWPGAILLLLLIGNAFWILAKVLRECRGQPPLENCRWYAYAILGATGAYLVAAIFGSFLFLETLWLLLLLPSAVQRATANTKEAHETSADGRLAEEAFWVEGLAGTLHPAPAPFPAEPQPVGGPTR